MNQLIHVYSNVAAFPATFELTWEDSAMRWLIKIAFDGTNISNQNQII